MFQENSIAVSTGYSQSLFGAFLKAPSKKSPLDLSNATLAECINARIHIHSAMHTSYREQLSSLIFNLRELEQEFNCVLMPSQISDIFWQQFIPWLTNKGMRESTIKHLCQQLKTIVAWAAKYGAKVSNTFENLFMKAKPTKQIALNRSDVAHILFFDCETLPYRADARKTMERVRDMFVLSCCLGQRHSDMVRIDKSCFKGGVFSIVQQKTGNKAVVDMKKFSVIDYKFLLRLLEKYDYKAPCPGDIKNYNKRLHKLMKYVGLCDIITRENKVLSQVRKEQLEQYKLISSHTARRTFASINKFDRHYDTYDIRKATGHATETSFLRYLCEDDDE